MGTMSPTISCNTCGTQLNEDPSLPREPCPTCGSRTRNIAISLVATVRPGGNLHVDLKPTNIVTQSPDDIESMADRSKVSFEQQDGLHGPPPLGKYVLRLFLLRSDFDVILGDLEERYRKDLTQVGVKKANCKYYKEIFKSIVPTLLRIVIKLGLLDWIRRKLGL